jgi:hypothetical protein
VEVNTAGAVIWTAALTDKGYLALRQSNGHTIATSGEDCRVYDIDASGKSTLIAGSLEKFPNAHLLWFSGFELMANGHFFIANWNGHGMEGKGPHAVEFDTNNNLVWKWDDHVAASTVTNVLSYDPGTTSIFPGPETMLHAAAPTAIPLIHQGVMVYGKAGSAELFRPDGKFQIMAAGPEAVRKAALLP